MPFVICRLETAAVGPLLPREPSKARSAVVTAYRGTI